MKTLTSLKIILGVSFAGLLFSGYLSAKEIFGGCSACSAASASNIFGIPVCIFGFVMYLIIVIIATAGLASGKR